MSRCFLNADILNFDVFDKSYGSLLFTGKRELKSSINKEEVIEKFSINWKLAPSFELAYSCLAPIALAKASVDTSSVPAPAKRMQ